MLIAQITDTHIKANGRLAYGRVDTAEMLARCVEHLNGLSSGPDVALVTGDLVDKGRPEEYAVLRDLLAPLDMPLYVIPGNHDERRAFRDAFADHSYLPSDGRFVHYVIDEYPVRLIGLDTTIPGAEGGVMCAERLAWLDARLAEEPARPTVIFMHHPPFITGIRNMDVNNCKGGAELGALVERHPQVIRLLCGHVHRAIQVHWHGVTASIAPSPAHAVAYNLREDAPHDFRLEPPACEIHYWREDTGLISHLTFIGDYEGPYPFRSTDGHFID
jgi:3',5'-cyclic AMP phosphodiesterase CpdA